ncbi:MAG: hypothetical protein HN509_03660, partial [Halobacteriovoraceae bacterium]|nr:hypothetical protein [Halobacteriovoraceae bacterium]
TQKAAKGLQDVLKSDPQLLIALFDHEDSDCEADLFLKSALKGSTLAIKFAEALKMPQQTINDIGTAALLRDIGAKEELKIYQSKVSELSKEDLLTYRQHPAASEKLLLGKEFVSKKVLALIKRHEEKISGTGFPDKVSDLSKEEQLLSLVCAYDRLITVEALPCDDALKSLKIDEMGNYDLKLITQLGELLKREMLV